VKKVIVAVLLAILLASLSLVACIGGTVIGSGNLETKTFNYSDFTEVEAHNGFQLELTKSSTFSIEITADDNMLEHIVVNKSGNILSIRPKSGSFRSVTLRAKITMPNLYKIELSGGSGADITGFSSSHDLSVELSGGSRVTGNITAGDTDFNLSGGSHVTLSGSADDLNVKCNGGSHLTLEAFSASNADVHLSGGSHATVNVDGIFNVNLSGGSHLKYIGQPTMGDINLPDDSTLSRK
jgi:hypothetical protein